MKSGTTVYMAASLGAALAFPGVGLAEEAQTYQNVLGFMYGQYDKSEITTLQFDAVHYFQPVNIANHPLAEAAFLERAASIGFLFNEASFYSSEQTTYVATLDYASTTNPLTLSAEYMGMNLTSSNSYGDLSASQYRFKAGSYVGASGRIQALFAKEKFEDETGTMIGLEAKQVKPNKCGISVMTLGSESMAHLCVIRAIVILEQAKATGTCWELTTIPTG